VKRWLDATDCAPNDSATQRVVRQERWSVAVRRHADDLKEQLRSAIDEFDRVVAAVRDVNDGCDLRVLRGASIVAFTTSGAAKYNKLLHALRARVVICEEAGEVFEAHVLASLSSSAESLILIGDHEQLRPKPSEYSLSVETANGHNLDVSMFERLLLQNQVEHCTLDTQRRMRPEISALIRAPLYPQLLDHNSVLAYPTAPRGFTTPLWFLDHRHPESSEAGSSSKTNQWEAEMVCSIQFSFSLYIFFLCCFPLLAMLARLARPHFLENHCALPAFREEQRK
jgi:hypothetical protein